MTLEDLEELANKSFKTIYNICHRNAGWGIQWHEAGRQGTSSDFKDGLVIYQYYPSIPDMISAEYIRLNS
jgi:hypothetical protein